MKRGVVRQDALRLTSAVPALLSAELAASGLSIGIAAAFLLVLLFAFASYTLRPPAETDFFKDPLNEQYGLDAHRHDLDEPASRDP